MNYLSVWINRIYLGSWAVHVSKYFFKEAVNCICNNLELRGGYIIKLEMDPRAIIWMILIVFINYLGSSYIGGHVFSILKTSLEWKCCFRKLNTILFITYYNIATEWSRRNTKVYKMPPFSKWCSVSWVICVSPPFHILYADPPWPTMGLSLINPS